MQKAVKTRKITVAEMAPHVHSFSPKENKANKIAEWLVAWINTALSNGQIQYGDFLPTKAELAFHIGVSLGTMQNVFRMVEDRGVIISRQKIGSCIKHPINNEYTEKLTSKREVTCEIIKRFLLDNNYKVGDKLLSIRKLEQSLGIPNATIRAAINSLITENILEDKNSKFYIKNLHFSVKYGEVQTLADKIAEHINDYIKENLKSGDRLPSGICLADMFNVSTKTIHDALNILAVAGIVKTRRGCYGTIVGQFNETKTMYYYEQVQEKIQKYIAENCKENDRLPTIKNFAEIFNVSTKTVKKALDNLAYEGYITLVQGRYGGTFVTNIPPINKVGYAWLALSPEYKTKN